MARSVLKLAPERAGTPSRRCADIMLARISLNTAENEGSARGKLDRVEHRPYVV